MMRIKIVGREGPSCQEVEVLVRQVASSMGVQAEFIKVTDPDELMKHPNVHTPGLVINEKVVCSGRIPNVAEISTWLAHAERGTD